MHPNATPHPLIALDVRHSRLDDATCVVSISGELDLATAPHLKHRLGELICAEAGRDVILDLSHLGHIDSTGLAVLIGVRRRLDDGQGLAIAGPSSPVRQILTLTGLVTSFDTFDTVQDARHFLAATRHSQDELPLSPDAALVLGLAQTALPFAESYADEARCWQRILLPADDAAEIDDRLQVEAPAPDATGYGPRLDRVLAHAAHMARDRGASAIRSGDLLRGVVSVYGDAFEDPAAA